MQPPAAAQPSALTRDVGHIAVIEHDGSNYDKGNLLARPALMRRFYETHGNNYDFLVVFTNFDIDTGEATAFHSRVRNQVTGVGLGGVGVVAEFAGAPSRLQGIIDMAAIDRYRARPLSFAPASPDFRATLNVVAHELGHQWLAAVRYQTASGFSSPDLLGRDGTHWSYLLDSDASVMYGADWKSEGNGRFIAGPVRQTYSSLDLYLMGLLDPLKVPPLTLLRNPAVDATGIPQEGDVVTAETETIEVAQVLAAEGPRTPDHTLSPKAFRVAFIVLTAPGVQPSDEDLAAVETVRKHFPAHFFALTRGVAIADTTLAEGPPVPRAGTPDLDRALAWLVARQSIDGRFEDSTHTAIRDTGAALDALTAAGVVGPSRDRAAAYLHNAVGRSVDAASRRAQALAESLSAQERAALIAQLLSFQNEDGGFGADLGFASDALDTALALRALKSLGAPTDARLRRAIACLAALASSDGGWPAVPGSDTSTVATAQALSALLDWRSLPGATAPLAAGLTLLTARQNGDGGFGESPSTPYATALALEALTRGAAAPEVIDPAISWLEREQGTDGSWGGARYPTALVIGALKAGVLPNLTVPADGLLLSPDEAQEGEVVELTVRVANNGRSAAPPSQVHVYDGIPSESTRIAGSSVPALAPGESATVVFTVTTEDRAGERVLYVVADSLAEVTESREDDNATTWSLRIVGRLPDLTIPAGGVVVVPAPPEEGEAAEVSIRVANQGTKLAPPTQLRLFDGDPRSGGLLLGSVSVPTIGVGEDVVLVLPWNTSGRRGDHVLYAVADATYTTPEVDETNNQATLPVAVTGPLPPGPDLEALSLSATPAALSMLPQVVELRVTIRNLGRDPAVSSLRVGSDRSGEAILAELPVSLAPRSSLDVSVPVTLLTAGRRLLSAHLDPVDTLPETNELNNVATIVLDDPGAAIDIEVAAGEMTVSSADLVAGETLVVSVPVRNRGTRPLSSVPVVFTLGGAQGPAEISRSLITLGAGETTTASFNWLASIEGESVSLSIGADPFNILAETNETNNLASFTVSVRPSLLSDLRVQGAEIATEPAPVREGSPALVRVRVTNPTPVPAAPFLVRAFLGDPSSPGAVVIGDAAVPGVGAQGEVLAEIAWPNVETRGLRVIGVLIDAEGAVPEYDETNNAGLRTVEIVGLPDLSVTSGEVAIHPAYPRAGQPIEVRATIRNLGGLPSAAFETRLVLGEDPAPVASWAVEALGAGESREVRFHWTPPPGAGEYVLSVLVDPAGEVPEQSEGNNRARSTLVVQDADLYLTAPYFSPNGDGVLDETAIGYRLTGPITVRVADEQGRVVATLATAAPSEGLVVWDGRNDAGQIALDGAYTISLHNESDTVLGRLGVTLDTNRSAIHDAAGTGRVALQLLPAGLRDVVSTFVWMPGEDELLAIVAGSAHGFAPGLVRIGLDGAHNYIEQDEWYRDIRFAGDRSVAPHGQTVLLMRSDTFDGVLHSVDLLTGERRTLAVPGSGAAEWSPDGGFIVTGRQVATAAGEFVAELPETGFANSGAGWTWSPDGRYLAFGNRIVSRDGLSDRTIPIPEAVMTSPDSGGPWQGVAFVKWRRDGRIHVGFGDCGEGCVARVGVLIDPVTEVVRQITSLDGQWSPDSNRLLHNREGSFVTDEGGLSQIPLASIAVSPSPGGSQASATCPAGTCVVRNLLNLVADVRVDLLPGNNGMVVSGLATDRNFDRYILDYADTNTPDSWRPVGSASEIPMSEDRAFAVWAPPLQGAYVLRLRAFDKAGNVAARARVVAWDVTPVLANLEQDGFLISPNGDGLRDAASFSYLVQEPTSVSVRVVGPGEAAPVIRSFTLNHSSIGPGGFFWDGRNSSNTVVSDGRYTVFINDLPFPVEVDNTPPEIGWSYDRLHAGTTPHPECSLPPNNPKIDYSQPIGIVRAGRTFHVFDANLKAWSASGSNVAGTTQRYIAELDGSGRAIFDGALPRPRRVGGRPLGLSDFDSPFEAIAPGREFLAEDLAGNRSVAPIVPLPEQLVLTEGNPGSRCEALAQADTRLLAPVDPHRTYAFKPKSEFFVRPVIRDETTVRFQHRPKSGGGWIEAPPLPEERAAQGGLLLDFPSIGLLQGPEYRGRFVASAAAGDLFSDEFDFSLCQEYAELKVEVGPGPTPSLAVYTLTLDHRLRGPIANAVVKVKGSGRNEGFMLDVRLSALDEDTMTATFIGPVAEQDCPEARLDFEVGLFGVFGQYAHDGVCMKLAETRPKSPPLRLLMERARPGFCGASPDALPLALRGVFPGSANVVVERGEGSARTVVADIGVNHVSSGTSTSVTVDVSAFPDEVPIRGHIYLVDAPQLKSCPVDITFPIDRGRPVIDISQPEQGGFLCAQANPATGREIAAFTLIASDASDLRLSGVTYTGEGGSAGSLSPICLGSGPDCLAFTDRVSPIFPKNRPLPLGFDVTDLPPGSYVVSFAFCDASGNTTTIERSFRLQRGPPQARLANVLSLFSPNEDGQADSALATIELLQPSVVSAVIRHGSEQGPIIRTLLTGQTSPVGQLDVPWDGRGDDGQTAPEGRYLLVVSVSNACGGVTTLPVAMEIDLTPPVAHIGDPGAGQTISGPGADIRGVAADSNFASYELSVGSGAAPSSFAAVAASRAGVAPPPAGSPFSLLGHWDAAGPGAFTLRLIVTDRAMNRTESRQTVNVGDLRYLGRFSATPTIFSPNGDGRRETVAIQYETLTPSRVRLEITDAAGTVLRTLEPGVLRDVGTFTTSFDGLHDLGTPVADGRLRVAIHLEDPLGVAPAEDTAAEVVIDRIAPSIAIGEPGPGAFVPRNRQLIGSITDPTLSGYEVRDTTPPVSRLLESGSAERRDAVLASFTALADGATTLVISAADAAENQATASVSFTIDSAPPTVSLRSPAGVLAKETGPVTVIGDAEDPNLSHTELSFGPGDDPGAFVEIALGSAAGKQLALGSWSTPGLPDGPYTLRVRAVDRSGNSAEARSAVVLDGAPPTANIVTPAEGAFLSAPTNIVGVVLDATLESWTLEMSPGPASSAYQWSQVATGTQEVDQALLAAWPLPLDGVYTLRLMVRDQAGHMTSLLRTVTVDATPPAPPSNPRARVSPTGAVGVGDVHLEWDANTEADLAAYVVRRAGAASEFETAVPRQADPGRPDGAHEYRIAAVDASGNESDPAVLKVQVDTTPPTVALATPGELARVAGLVDIRGTAFSAGDFKEYRLLVGAGESPTVWMPVKVSTLPVAGGVLGTWLALGEGPHVLALEAEDSSENVARTTRTVTVDTQPPLAPQLTDVEPGVDPDALTLLWTPSASTDVAGYLVRRNGRLANAPGTVIGDERAYLLPPPTYSDPGLPDGTHCYTVSAMDEAGNQSPSSNEICRTLENRAPRAVLVQPAPNLRFEDPIRLVAFSADLDIASIRFQVRVSGAPGWTDISLDTAPPFESMLDPATLAAGPHELRALATDQGGRTDPEPATLVVIVGAPLIAPEVTTTVSGGHVTLSWPLGANPEVVGYLVDRDGSRLTPDPIPDLTWVDAALTPGAYEYRVFAVDSFGNSSPPAIASASVYAPALDFVFPVTSDPTIEVAGSEVRGGVVYAIRDGGEIASSPASADGFVLEVPLQDGPNLVHVIEKTDPADQSLPSEDLLLIANTPPDPVVALTAILNERSAELHWGAPLAPDVFGFVVERNGDRLTRTVRRSSGDAFSFGPDLTPAQDAFDGDPATAWRPAALNADWLLVLPEPVLIERIVLRFASNQGPLSYRIQLLAADGFLVAGASPGVAGDIHTHVFPNAIAADRVLLSILSPAGPISLSELEVFAIDALPASSLSFADEAVADGTHTYRVTPIDRYGSLGPFATAEVSLPLLPPEPPTGLMAGVHARDVVLSWNQSPESDVTAYVVLRDGVRVAQTTTPAYRDIGRPNGTYTYRVLAVDTASHESLPSEPADATLTGAPLAPEIFFPTTAGETLHVDTAATDVRGFADVGTLSILEVNGAFAGASVAQVCSSPWVETSFVPLPSLISASVIARSGMAIFFTSGETASVLTRVNLRTGERGQLENVQGGSIVMTGAAAAAEGGRVVYAVFAEGGSGATLKAWDLYQGGRTISAIEGQNQAHAIARDGSRIAFMTEIAGEGHLVLYDWDTGSIETLMGVAADTVEDLRFSPDGEALAFLRVRPGGTGSDLWILDIATRTSTFLAANPWSGGDWSPDGRVISFTQDGGRISLFDRSSLAVTDAGEGFDPRFASDGDHLSFLRFSSEGAAEVFVRSLASGIEVAVLTAPYLSSNAQWIADGRLAIPGPERVIFLAPCHRGIFEIPGVALSTGENVLIARSTETGGSVSPDSSPVRLVSPGATSPDFALAPGTPVVVPSIPLVGLPAQIRVDVSNQGTAAGLQVPVTIEVLSPTGALELSEVRTIGSIQPGSMTSITVAFTPSSAGPHTLKATIDKIGSILETDETNNAASRLFTTAASASPAVTLATDRASYPAETPVAIAVTILNPGPSLVGTADLHVEDATGEQVGIVEVRSLSLEFGGSASYAAFWHTARLYFGEYVLRLRIRDGGGAVLAEASRIIQIEPDLRIVAGLLADRSVVPVGSSADFGARFENLGRNAPLLDARVRFRVMSGAAVAFETTTPLPTLVPGSVRDGRFSWPLVSTAGSYLASVAVLNQTGDVLAAADTPFTATAPPPPVRGDLALAPPEVLLGSSTMAELRVVNPGSSALSGVPLAVEVLGPSGEVLSSSATLVDLPAGATRALSLPANTAGLNVGRYPVLLRSGSASLDRATLTVHGPISPPAPLLPENGATINTTRPTLVVANAATAPGVSLSYDFEIFGDASLTQPYPGAVNVPEGTTTSWRVFTALSEGKTFFWRARARDGFSASPWSAVASFTVAPAPCPVISIAPSTLPQGLSGVPYSVRFSVSGGPGPFAYSIAGALPEGLSFSDGLIEGTPTSAGAFPFTLNISDPEGCAASAPHTLVIGTPVAQGDVVLSEFRWRGPLGAFDEYVEIANRTDHDIVVSAPDGSAGWSIGRPGTAHAVIPSGTRIPRGGHWFAAGESFSLASYPGGATEVGFGDALVLADLPDDLGLALFTTANPANYNDASRLDSVGGAFEDDPLYTEGERLRALGAVSPSAQTAWVRVLTNLGIPGDTSNNRRDFVFVATDAGLYGPERDYAAVMGGPNPEGVTSPHDALRAVLPDALVDPSRGPNQTPNRAVVPGAPGSISYRRTFTNQTGSDITRLRFKVISLTTRNTRRTLAVQADLRVADAPSLVLTIAGAGVPIEGARLEQALMYPILPEAGTDPAGGLNSTLSVNLPEGLEPGGRINVNLRARIAAGGYYLFVVLPQVQTGGETPQ